MAHLSGTKTCLLGLVFVALFAKLSSQKIIQVDQPYPYIDYDKEREDNSCRNVQMQCNYRSGCGSTLQSFIFECDDLINNRTNHCSTRCKNTLVGLMSTQEGQKMINCDCQGHLDCLMARRQIESCRASVVYATRFDTVVSCTEAQWICMADSECGKALEYYNFNCRAMFRGKRCNQRCKNSLRILSRQSQATKLADCRCEYNERIGNHYCSDIKRNMEQLCDLDLQKTIELNVETNRRIKQQEFVMWERTSERPPPFEWPELVVTESPFDMTETVEIVTYDQNKDIIESETFEDDVNDIEETDYDETTTVVATEPEGSLVDESNEIPLDYVVDDPEDMENEITDEQETPDDEDLSRGASGSPLTTNCSVVTLSSAIITFLLGFCHHLKH